MAFRPLEVPVRRAPPPSKTPPICGVAVTVSGQHGTPCLMTLGPRALKASLAARAAPQPWQALPGVMPISSIGIWALVILSLIYFSPTSLLLNPCHRFLYLLALDGLQGLVPDQLEVADAYLLAAEPGVELQCQGPLLHVVEGLPEPLVYRDALPWAYAPVHNGDGVDFSD